MKEKLKRQKLKKYALIALAVIVIAGTSIGFEKTLNSQMGKGRLSSQMGEMQRNRKIKRLPLIRSIISPSSGRKKRLLRK